jgi:hypothetical protein
MAHVNDVVHQNYYDNTNKIFCKRLHNIVDGDEILSTCDTCPYLSGSLNGSGIECEWEDDFKSVFMSVKDPTAEMLRVSKLIDNKVIRKG